MMRLALAAAVVLLATCAYADLYDNPRISCDDCVITATHPVSGNDALVRFTLTGDKCKDLKAFFIRRPCCDVARPIWPWKALDETVGEWESFRDKRNLDNEEEEDGKGKESECRNPLDAELADANTCGGTPELKKVRTSGHRGCHLPNGEFFRFDIRPETSPCGFNVLFSEDVELPEDLAYVLRTRNKCKKCGEDDIECEAEEPVFECPNPFKECTRESAENNCNCTRTVVRSCTSVLIDGELSNGQRTMLWDKARSDTEVECCKDEDLVTGVCKKIDNKFKCVIDEDDIDDCPAEPKRRGPI